MTIRITGFEYCVFAICEGVVLDAPSNFSKQTIQKNTIKMSSSETMTISRQEKSCILFFDQKILIQELLNEKSVSVRQFSR